MSTYLRKFRDYLRKHETVKGLLLVGIVILSAIGIWAGVRFALNTEFPVLVVDSGSMCPPVNCTLAIGDLIVIRGQDPSSIQGGPACGVRISSLSQGSSIGSIIVFRPPPSQQFGNHDYLVVHRVREIRTNSASGELSFMTQGDNYLTNGNCDTWATPTGAIPASRVVGVYQYTLPGSPYVGLAIRGIRAFMYDEGNGQPRPQGIAVIVALIAALIAFDLLEPSKKKKNATEPPPAPAVKPQPEKPAEPEVSPSSSSP